MKEYNEGFSEGYTTISDVNNTSSTLSPGDVGFDENDMLRDEYFVYEDATFILAGPPNNVVSYTWRMFNPENNTTIFVNTLNGSLDFKDFILYVPDSNLEVNNTYKLTLTIVSSFGIEYNDTCSVVVYKHYIY